MFKYDDKKGHSIPKEKQRKIVTAVRAVTYIHDNGVISHGFEPVQERVVSSDYQLGTVVPDVVDTKTVMVEIPKKQKKEIQRFGMNSRSSAE